MAKNLRSPCAVSCSLRYVLFLVSAVALILRESHTSAQSLVASNTIIRDTLRVTGGAPIPREPAVDKGAFDDGAVAISNSSHASNVLGSRENQRLNDSDNDTQSCSRFSPHKEQADGADCKAFSFLLPTRGRPTQCINSIRSLATKAVDRSCFEILLAFDSDDTSRQQILDFCAQERLSCPFTISKRYGYAHLHAYVNGLVKIANGKYFWLWNDDVLMETHRWDVIMQEKLGAWTEGPNLVWDFKNNHAEFVFPLVPRIFVETMGHFSLNGLNDYWIQLLFKHMLQHYGYTEDISLFHNRGSKSNVMVVDYQESTDAGTSWVGPDFQSDFSLLLRMIDANRIIRKLFPEKITPFEVSENLRKNMEQTAFIGLTRLGLPMAVGLAARGHFVMGYDLAGEIDEYTSRQNAYTEAEAGPEAHESIEGWLDHALLKITTDFSLAAEFGKFIFIALPNQDLDSDAADLKTEDEAAKVDCSSLQSIITDVVKIAEELRSERIVILTTILTPGTLSELIPTSIYVKICYAPLFASPQTVLHDLYHPLFVLMACSDPSIEQTMTTLYGTITSSPVFVTTLAAGEAIAFAYNDIRQSKNALTTATYLFEAYKRTPGINMKELAETLIWEIGKLCDRTLSVRSRVIWREEHGNNLLASANSLAMSLLLKRVDAKLETLTEMELISLARGTFLTAVAHKFNNLLFNTEIAPTMQQ